MRHPTGGTIKINGSPLKFGSAASAIKSNMARIPEDRIDIGLMMDLTVEENLVLENHASSEFHTYGLMKSKRIRRFSDDLISAYDIMTAGRRALTKSLSGGNLQKVMLARELAGKPAVVVAAQPTRGLDIGAMEYIHHRILQERERGAGILLISEDLGRPPCPDQKFIRRKPAKGDAGKRTRWKTGGCRGRPAHPGP